MSSILKKSHYKVNKIAPHQKDWENSLIKIPQAQKVILLISLIELQEDKSDNIK